MMLDLSYLMAGALDTYPRRDLAEYFLNIPIYFQLYLK